VRHQQGFWDGKALGFGLRQPDPFRGLNRVPL
jgi:hypothetical protein